MHDAIVVGARVAGSTTAMLLARRGLRVLLLDRAVFPSDTVCAHRLAPVAVAVLESCGLLDRVVATGCPPAERTAVMIGTSTVTVRHTTTYAPRRHVLDGVLLDAALAAGVEFQDNFAVRDLVWEGDRVTGVFGATAGGHTVYQPARIVIGADGRQSVVAAAVRAPAYRERAAANCCYYAYWAGLDTRHPEVFLGAGCAVLLHPTNGGQTCALVARPVTEWAAFKRSPEAGCESVINRFPGLAERFISAIRVSRFFGSADLGGAFRRPWGRGWALVGDAGLHKDPLSGCGISDALFHARLLASAVDEGLSGRAPLTEALAAYHLRRDEAASELYDLAFALSGQAWGADGAAALVERLHAAHARQLERIVASS